MAAKKILFQIEIEGSTVALKNADDLKMAISELQKQMKAETDDTVYDAIEAQVLQLKAALKDVQAEQAQTIREFQAADTGEGSYVRTNAELVKLRDQYRDLSKIDQKSTVGLGLLKKIKSLDDEVKKVDESMGIFVRNVGNYPKLMADTFANIPGFSQINEGAALFQDGLEQIGLTASATGKVLTAAFIGFQIAQKIFEGISAIKEFADETNALRGNIGRLTAETEEGVDAAAAGIIAISQTYKQEQGEVFAAINAASKAFGVSFSDAQALVDKGFLAGADSNGKFLDSLAEMAPKAADAGASMEQFVVSLTQAGRAGLQEDEVFEKLAKNAGNVKGNIDGLIDTTDELTKKQMASRKAAQELAEAKIEVSKQLEALTGGSTKFSQQAQTGLLRVLSFIIEGLRPIGEALGEIPKAFDALFRSMGLVTKQGSATGAIMNTLSLVFRAVGFAMSVPIKAATFLFSMLAKVIGVVTEFAGQFSVVRSTVSSFGGVMSSLGQQLSNFPAFFAGITAAASQMAGNIGRFFSVMLINAQIVGKQLQQLNPFNSNDDELGRQIEELRAQRPVIAAAGRSVGEAYTEAYRNALKVGGTKALDEQITMRDLGISEQKERDEKDAKAAADARKKEEDAARKAREEAQKGLVAYYGERGALIAELSARLADITIDNIRDEQERQVAQENRRFDLLKKELAKGEADLLEKQKETRAKIAEAYSENSQEVLRFDREASDDLAAQRAEAASVLEQEEVAHQRRLAEIQKTGAEARLKAQLEGLSVSLRNNRDALIQASNEAANELNYAISAALKSGSADGEELILRLSFEADQRKLQSEAALIDKEVQRIADALDRLETAGISEGAKAEFDALDNELTEMYNRRSELERQLTESTIAEAKRREQARLSEIEKGLEMSVQIVDIADQIFAAGTARELAALDEQQTAREENIRKLEEQAKNATGTQKTQLEERIAGEKKALEDLSKQRQYIEKEDARRAKSFAIIQSIIQTALNVTKALGSGFIVPNIPAGILAGVMGGIQTGLIAAQPAAKGGLMGGVPHQGDGLVVMAQNIPSLANGDNVLATVGRGEVVLNRHHQRQLGGAPTFRAIGVPGFNAGGVVGGTAPIDAPDLRGVSTAERIHVMENNVLVLTNAVNATNERIDRIKVRVVAEDVRDVLAETDTLQAMATL